MLTEQKSTDTEPKAERCGDGGLTHWDACPCRQRAHKATVEYLETSVMQKKLTIERLYQEITEKNGVIFEQSTVLQIQAGQIEHLTQENNGLKACIIRRGNEIKALRLRAERAERSLARVNGGDIETIGVKA